MPLRPVALDLGTPLSRLGYGFQGAWQIESRRGAKREPKQTWGSLRPEYVYGSGLIQQSDASGLERDLTGLNRRHFLEGRFGPVSMQIEPARRIASRSH